MKPHRDFSGSRASWVMNKFFRKAKWDDEIEYLYSIMALNNSWWCFRRGFKRVGNEWNVIEIYLHEELGSAFEALNIIFQFVGNLQSDDKVFLIPEENSLDTWLCSRRHFKSTHRRKIEYDEKWKSFSSDNVCVGCTKVNNWVRQRKDFSSARRCVISDTLHDLLKLHNLLYPLSQGWIKNDRTIIGCHVKSLPLVVDLFALEHPHPWRSPQSIYPSILSPCLKQG